MLQMQKRPMSNTPHFYAQDSVFLLLSLLFFLLLSLLLLVVSVHSHLGGGGVEVAL